LTGVSAAIRVIVVAASLWVAACASRALPKAVAVTPPPAAAADALVNEGCYRCLREAFVIYESAGLPDRVFSTALLIAVREKELGLEASPWLERARSLATAATSTYVDIAAGVPWTSVANAPDFDPPPRPTPTVLQARLAFLTRPEATTLLDRYLLLATMCSRRGGAPPEHFAADVPLLQFRLGICGFDHRQDLDTVFASSARFVEAGFFLARYEMTNTGFGRAQVTRALPLLLDAHEGLPESPIITATLAGVWAARNEYARALTLYDEVLAVRPRQRDALLGRTTVLTYLGRPDEAIATASRLIEFGTWYLGDAYYWRAWNYYNTDRRDPARSDVERARTFQSSDDLLTLSGMIAYDDQRRVDARRDFDAARAVNPANCSAVWYLAVLDVDERLWPAARELFSHATECYRAAALAAEAEELSPDLSPEALVQQQQDRARRLASHRRQEARSALNVAMLSLQLGDRDAAKRFAEIAVYHDFPHERAENVLRSLSP
jgi:tetratricopeptide (TPR) repeat protein